MKLDVNDFIEQQLAVWPLAAQNYSALEKIEQRSFHFESFTIIAQYNPARIISSSAKVDAKSIAERPCFLCRNNRPQNQLTIEKGDFEILVNPFPIFRHHLTIVSHQHEKQQLGNHVVDMFDFAKMLPSLAIFYNGAQCGASAPDHLHFQAGSIESWPLFDDYLKQNLEQILSVKQGVITTTSHIGRQVYRIEAYNPADAQYLKDWLIMHYRFDEDLMNVVAYYKDDKFYMYIIPRRKFRPWQYTAENSRQFLISPASVEVGGIFIVPQAEQFARLTKTDIIDILNQICF